MLNITMIHFNFLGALNTTVIILLCIYFGGSIASFFRSWLFTLAGERLVARIRRLVGAQSLI